MQIESENNSVKRCSKILFFKISLEGLNIPVLSSLCIDFCRVFMHYIVGIGVVEEETDSFE